MEYSVVMAVRNGDRLINQALNSIRNQNYPPKKIIVIDDRSSVPATASINQVNNVLIFNSISKGQMSALNQGIDKVNTEFVSFLDHDDLWPRNRQENHSKVISSGKFDCVVSRVLNFQGFDLPSEAFMHDMGISRVLGACTFSIKVFDKVGLFDTTIDHHGIIEWWDRAEKCGINVVHDEQPGLYRRIHNENSGIKNKKEARKSLFEVLRKLK